MQLTIAFAAILCVVTSARHVIRPMGYLRLPFSVGDNVAYALEAGAAEEATYDPSSHLMYIVGEDSGLLHVVDISNPSNPARLFTHKFDPVEGVPRDVEVCGDLVAVSLSADIEVFPGHVQLFNTYSKATNTLVHQHTVTVGEFPDMIQFSPDCKKLVVANEGRAGLDYAKRYMDPEGSVTIIYITSGSGAPSARFVDFQKYNHRHDIRAVSKAIPQSLLQHHSTVAQELEPEYITIPDNSNAYVTFQENNLMAKISLRDGIVSDLFTLPPKMYSKSLLDGSDRDGGIHMLNYPLYGNRQPDVVKSLTFNSKTYLITADEGTMTSYNTGQHGFTWSEGERARVVEYQKGIDPAAIGNDSFVADLNDDSKLGRLYMSKVDGVNPFTGKIEDIYTFGGRGFSIWDSSSYNLIYDSGDELERRARDSYYNVFNTDFRQTTVYSPETLKDKSSANMGPKPNGLDVITDRGNTFIVVGSETTGIIYLYSANFTTNSPTVHFQDIYRRGKTDYIYQQLFADGGDAVGDMLISDIGLIAAADSPTNITMFYVLATGSASVSLYAIENLGPDLPSLNP